eukprot:TRINITY_DN18724_c0_g1_i1.p1 TRINITY_DN18724_c0_g1~~TRINITY_DN18724_c0_g1_i1.p1  ORF type:complete len:621 (-),score=91.73 TRINITY_DN18724_c0_g1_i1:243-2105(-)
MESSTVAVVSTTGEREGASLLQLALDSPRKRPARPAAAVVCGMAPDRSPTSDAALGASVVAAVPTPPRQPRAPAGPRPGLRCRPGGPRGEAAKGTEASTLTEQAEQKAQNTVQHCADPHTAAAAAHAAAAASLAGRSTPVSQVVSSRLLSSSLRPPPTPRIHSLSLPIKTQPAQAHDTLSPSPSSMLAVPEEGYTEEYLQQYCNVDDIAAVKKLEIRVDAVLHSIDSLGDYLCNLRELRLNDSSLLCLRELGAGLSQLEVLYLNRCGLQDLDGVATMPALRELYLPFNDVTTLQPLTAADRLAVLDVEGNCISEMEEISTLWLCTDLREMCLSGNPLEKACEYSRETVFQFLPQLEVLDYLYKDPAAAPCWSAQVEDPLCGLKLDPETLLDLYIESDDGIYLDLYLEDGEEEYEDDCSPSGDISSPQLGSCTSSGSSPSREPRVSSTMYSRCSETNPRPMSARGPRLTHPLLVQGLSDMTSSPEPDSFRAEPNDLELLLERVKRAKPRPSAAAASPGCSPPSSTSGRPLTARGSAGGFSLQMAERGNTEALATPRGSSYGLVELPSRGAKEDTSSQLTCGASLAGNPLMAARQRRSQTAASGGDASSYGIRELLRRHDVF